MEVVSFGETTIIAEYEKLVVVDETPVPAQTGATKSEGLNTGIYVDVTDLILLGGLALIVLVGCIMFKKMDRKTRRTSNRSLFLLFQKKEKPSKFRRLILQFQRQFFCILQVLLAVIVLLNTILEAGLMQHLTLMLPFFQTVLTWCHLE